MTRLRKTLVLLHRYVGIIISALVVMWFATGITMMYVGGMPRLTPEFRLERMTPVRAAEVKLTPAQAADAAEFGTSPSRATLYSILGRPAYRFGGNGGTTIVYADTGEVADEFTESRPARLRRGSCACPSITSSSRARSRSRINGRSA